MFTRLITFFSEDARGLLYGGLSYVTGASIPIIDPNISAFVTLLLQWFAYCGTISIAIFTIIGYLHKWGLFKSKKRNQ